MKHLLVLALVCFSVVAFGQTKDDVKFTAIKHSFGKIKQNVPATYTFTFKNASAKKPLIIESATAQWGCTTPEYPKSPVGKGKNGTIKVTYNAAAVGAFTKTVTVKFANIAEPVVLTIDGDVQAATK
jgi:hypothetical protein